MRYDSNTIFQIKYISDMYDIEIITTYLEARRYKFIDLLLLEFHLRSMKCLSIYIDETSEKKSPDRYNAEKLQSVIQEIYHCSNRNVLHELSLIIIFSDSPTPNIFINT